MKKIVKKDKTFQLVAEKAISLHVRKVKAKKGKGSFSRKNKYKKDFLS